MSKIQQLDPHVADLIAAGEVVDRPASVIKELLENAIDAGAASVIVELQNGGMSLIRVTDNGSGMGPDDAGAAFLRHATSKLRSERDLESIGTLGFRGEALAAIAAVSRISLLTRVTGMPLGTSLSLEGGAVVEREEAGCPEGTTVVVRDLFFNTPARLKFVKRDAAEGAAAFAVVQAIALSRPELSVRFIRDGKQALLTPGDGQLKSAMYSVFGRDLALGFTPVIGSGEDISVSGFVSMPSCCRGSRGYQHFFVNGRSVRSRTLTAALEEAYKNQKMVGRFPGCVLHLATKLSAVDVNVHPAKTEVKFQNESAVFRAVYHAVLSSLEGEDRRPSVPKAAVRPVHDDTPFARQISFPSGKGEQNSSLRLASPTFSVERIPYREKTIPAAARESPAPSADAATAPSPPPAARPPLPPPDPVPWRLVGEIMQTYILVEQGDKLILIDKHAAHERMCFDRLKAEPYSPMSQSLLAPAVVTPPAKEAAALARSLPLLREFGFEIEPFGGDSLIVRRVPSGLAEGEIEDTLCRIAASLLTAGGADPAAARDELLRTVACKAAIKGGQRNAPEELSRVAEAVLDGGVKYCPHGRPVAVELTRSQMEKQFRRT